METTGSLNEQVGFGPQETHSLTQVIHVQSFMFDLQGVVASPVYFPILSLTGLLLGQNCQASFRQYIQ